MTRFVFSGYPKIRSVNANALELLYDLLIGISATGALTGSL